MKNSAPIPKALAALAALSACASAQAGPTPADGRFNLRCSISLRTVSGPPVPAKITATYAIDLKSQTWCVVEEQCLKRFGLRQVDGSTFKFTVADSFANHESFLVNLETGKLVGSADDAPAGLMNGFRTYLAEGDCAQLPYAEREQP